MFQSARNKIYFIKAYLHAKFLGMFIGKIGNHVFIQDNTRIADYKCIEIGNNVYISHHVEFDSTKEKIKIGNYVMIGPYTYLGTINHGYAQWNKPMYFQEGVHDGITIEDDVWIGTKVIILSGVTIGRGAIVGAGAVVTKDVQPFTIVGGVPARLIKPRFSQDQLRKAKKADFSKYLGKRR